MGILSINMAISFPTSVFSSYVTSQEKFIFQKIINMGKTVISPIMCIIFLYNGFGSIGMVIVTTVLTLLVDTINIFYCFFKLKMRISFKNPDFALSMSFIEGSRGFSVFGVVTIIFGLVVLFEYLSF